VFFRFMYSEECRGKWEFPSAWAMLQKPLPQPEDNRERERASSDGKDGTPRRGTAEVMEMAYEFARNLNLGAVGSSDTPRKKDLEVREEKKKEKTRHSPEEVSPEKENIGTPASEGRTGKLYVKAGKDDSEEKKQQQPQPEKPKPKIRIKRSEEYYIDLHFRKGAAPGEFPFKDVQRGMQAMGFTTGSKTNHNVGSAWTFEPADQVGDGKITDYVIAVRESGVCRLVEDDNEVDEGDKEKAGSKKEGDHGGPSAPNPFSVVGKFVMHDQHGPKIALTVVRHTIASRMLRRYGVDIDSFEVVD